MIIKYIKKPVEIEAMQWFGVNHTEFKSFYKGKYSIINNITSHYDELEIETLEGNMMRVKVNDYIIKGVLGEFYPCKPEKFEKTYEIAK